MKDKFKFSEEERNVVKDLFDKYSTTVYLYGETEFVNTCIDHIEQIIQDRGNSIESIEWQKCPKCDGQGIVSKPPWIAGDVYEWSSTAAQHQCNVCNGAMIILSPKQPNK